MTGQGCALDKRPYISGDGGERMEAQLPQAAHGEECIGDHHHQAPPVPGRPCPDLAPIRQGADSLF